MDDLISECMDWMPNCHLLDEQYCHGDYRVVAAEVCARRCGLCDGKPCLTNKVRNKEINE